MRKHRHKYKIISAQMYGAKYPSGTISICDCGQPKFGIREKGLFDIEIVKWRKFKPVS